MISFSSDGVPFKKTKLMYRHSFNVSHSSLAFMLRYLLNRCKGSMRIHLGFVPNAKLRVMSCLMTAKCSRILFSARLTDFITAGEFCSTAEAVGFIQGPRLDSLNLSPHAKIMRVSWPIRP